MPEVSETIKFTNKEELPESLAKFQGLGLDEHNRLVGLDEEGDTTQLRNLGQMVIEIALKSGMAEEITPTDVSPETKLLLNRLDQMQQKIDELDKALKDKDQAAGGSVTPAMQAEIERVVGEQTKDLRQQVETLKTEKSDLETQNKDLKAKVKELGGNPDETKEVDGFKQGDEVALQQADGKFETGYKVTNFPKEGDKQLIEIKKDGNDPISVEPDKIKQRAVLSEDQILPSGTPPPSPAPPQEKKKFEVRETYGRRLRNRTPWAMPEREYYVGEGGRPYYVDEGGGEVYVTEEEVRGRSVGAGALALAGVAGVIIWELGVEKIFGWDGSSAHLKEVVHNQSTIIHNQGVQIHDLHQVNDHLTHVDKELLHAHDHDRRMIHGLHNQIHRAAKHQDRIINDLRGEIARDHAQEARSIGGIHDKLQNTGIYWGARYPWDWAANKVGSLRAEGWLHTLAARAKAGGHNVVWLHNNGKEILKVDGTENTSHVVSVLNQYR